MKKRPTIADVAKKAGVSMMTVSRAINHKPGLSEELRKKILIIAEEMGFKPNQIARGLATQKSATIGLVVPDITNPFFSHLALGVEGLAFEHGYSVFVLNTAEMVTREKSILDLLVQQRVDGVILCGARMPMDEMRKQFDRFPGMVLVNRTLETPHPNVVSIDVDDQQGASLAVRHFLTQNRKSIAYITGPHNSHSNMKRLKGYRSTLEAAGIKFETQLVQTGAPNTEGGRIACQALLQRRPDVDAVFAFNDLVAVGIIQVCQEYGKLVPQEIAVIGADDIPLATIFKPQLSTLHINLGDVGRQAMQSLFDLIQGEAPPDRICIQPELILRESA